MEQTSYIHRILRKRSKKANWPYLSSIICKNKDIPLFEEEFGQLDYDWLLKVTEHRICKEIEPSVIRHVDGKNLSLNHEYRKRDFYVSLLLMDDDFDVIKIMYSSRARYFYVMGEMKKARFHFLRGVLNWKTVLYFITSYNKRVSRLIVKKFGVFG